jgi:hypothetical protein
LLLQHGDARERRLRQCALSHRAERLLERARRIDAALRAVDRSSWKWERWRGWTAWKP